jgi:hypothetical protein
MFLHLQGLRRQKLTAQHLQGLLPSAGQMLSCLLHM